MHSSQLCRSVAADTDVMTLMAIQLTRTWSVLVEFNSSGDSRDMMTRRPVTFASAEILLPLNRTEMLLPVSSLGSVMAMVRNRMRPHFNDKDASSVEGPACWLKVPHPSAATNATEKLAPSMRGAKHDIGRALPVSG
jgi:hypothetical protein